MAVQIARPILFNIVVRYDDLGSLSDFPGQFLYREAGGSLDRAGHLTLHTSLPIVKISTEAGAVGYLIGFATNGKDYLKDSVSVKFKNFKDFERWHKTLIGRFVILISLEGEERLYPDAAASMSIVYSENHREFASSTGLISSEASASNVELVKLLNIPAEDNWYPFGLTERHDVLRLLPNHYLDLKNFRATRFNSPDQKRLNDARRTLPPKRTVSAIFDRMRSAYAGFASGHDCVLTLTAGRDSRMVLAAALESKARLAAYTYEGSDGAAFGDVLTAATLSRRLNIDYEVIPYKKPNQADMDAWQHRTGHCVGGRVSKAVTSMNGKMRGRLIVNGLCGEVGRAFYWTEQDFTAANYSAAAILKRLKLPFSPELEARANAWLTSLTGAHWLDILDFAYIELRLGCWAGPQRYGMLDEFGVSLFNSHEIYELLLSLPAEYRFSQSLSDDFVKFSNPLLAQYPINKTPRKDELRYAALHPGTYARMRSRLRGWID